MANCLWHNWVPSPTIRCHTFSIEQKCLFSANNLSQQSVTTMVDHPRITLCLPIDSSHRFFRESIITSYQSCPFFRHEHKKDMNKICTSSTFFTTKLYAFLHFFNQRKIFRAHVAIKYFCLQPSYWYIIHSVETIEVPWNVRDVKRDACISSSISLPKGRIVSLLCVHPVSVTE